MSTPVTHFQNKDRLLKQKRWRTVCYANTNTRKFCLAVSFQAELTAEQKNFSHLPIILLVKDSFPSFSYGMTGHETLDAGQMKSLEFIRCLRAGETCAQCMGNMQLPAGTEWETWDHACQAFQYLGNGAALGSHRMCLACLIDSVNWLDNWSEVFKGKKGLYLVPNIRVVGVQGSALWKQSEESVLLVC